MKLKTLLLSLSFLLAQTVSAKEIQCFGTKFFHSPYPGASSSAPVGLRIDAGRETVDLSVGREQESFRLVTLKETPGKFLFTGEGKTKLRGSLTFLGPEGVTVKVNRFQGLDFNCAVFRVIE